MTASFEISTASGVINAPPSKSYSHRALICSAFSNKSTVSNLCLCDDISATLISLRNLGALISVENDNALIIGIDKNKLSDNILLDCNESASTLRFLIPIVLTLGVKVTFTGSKRLFERPLDEYEKLCKKQNFLYEKSENLLSVCGNLTAGVYGISGEISSQFVTGMVLALSTVFGDSVLYLNGKISGKSYIDMTIDVLESFGVKTKFSDNKIYICGKLNFVNTDYFVENDFSNLAYIDAFNYTDGNVVVKGISDNTKQGDSVYIKLFNDIKNGKKDIDINDCPDLGPILYAVSSLYGGCRFTGTKRLSVKESDRNLSMKQELEKFGVALDVGDDFVVVNPENISRPSCVLSSHNDHRIAMALSLLCAKFGGSISEAESVNKSYPQFFEDLKRLGINVDFS